jgi:hypothetical protein
MQEYRIHIKTLFSQVTCQWQLELVKVSYSFTAYTQVPHVVGFCLYKPRHLLKLLLLIYVFVLGRTTETIMKLLLLTYCEYWVYSVGCLGYYLL